MVEVKEALQDKPVFVALEGNRLGSEIKNAGASFALSSIYGEKTQWWVMIRLLRFMFELKMATYGA